MHQKLSGGRLFLMDVGYTVGYNYVGSRNAVKGICVISKLE